MSEDENDSDWESVDSSSEDDPGYYQDESQDIVDDYADFEDFKFSDEDLEAFADMMIDMDIEQDYDDSIIETGNSTAVRDFSEIDVASVFKDYSIQSNVGVKEFKEVKVSRIPKGSRKYRDLKTNHFQRNRLKLRCRGGKVYAMNKVVGLCKIDFGIVEVDGSDLFNKADLYTEEVKGKGSGYGFSSFLHLMCVISLSPNEGFIEPFEGCDYTMISDGRELTIEVTGMSYEKRRTSANMILNKYALVPMICDDPRLQEVIQYSNCEETNDTSYLRNSNFFSRKSVYTEQFDNIHYSIRKLTKPQINGITKHVSKWLLSVNDSFVRENISRPKFKFEGGKNGKFPSPFKVRRFKHTNDLIDVKPESNLWRDNSGIDWYEDKHNSYRTVEESDDYIRMCTSHSVYVDRVNDKWYSVSEKAVDILERLQALQSARIQKELYDKIHSYRGCYYSEKDGVGISWSTTGKESLTYNCIFYSSEDPKNEKMFGIWVKEGNYYRSPGFKVSRQDISFVKKNYDAMVAMYISMISVHEKTDSYDEFLSLFTVLTCNSSWKTSDYADNCRFVTTGHLSGNQVSDLLVKPINVGKFIRSSEFLYMHLVNRFLDDPPDRTLTPLFRLKLKHMCLEKDLGLAVNWPNREADHESECCRKLIERTSEEILVQDQVISFYALVNSYFNKLFSVGVDYHDTKEVLDKTPTEPVLNPIFYIAMCKSCEKEIEAAAMSQVSTGYSVNDMVSDRGSMFYDDSKGCWSESKVVDELSRLVHREKIKGPYDGLIKLFRRKHDKVYIIKSKNGRGRREFATQHIESRFIQNFEEKLAAGVSMSAPDDQFLSPHKYNDMVAGFTRVVNSELPVVGSSEDRSFHCGHNMPEALSIACLCHSVVNEIPYFTTLSSIKRCNTERLCILPKGFNEEVVKIPGNLPIETVDVLSKNKVVPRQCVRVRKHAMQGQHAVISGVLNTTHVKGVENIMQKNTLMFEDSHVFTTQDDVGRAVSISKGVSPNWAQGNYLMKPMRTLNMTLQKNNDRKHVVIEHDKSAYGILEVNNILITGSGMVSQSHIHPHHIIQPLTSDSIIIDIMDAVNNSRQSIFWGDSPTLAWACMEMSLYTLRMKWMLTKGHINYLKEIKLLPNNVDELVSGFFPRSVDSMKIFINYMTDEHINEAIMGIRSLYDKACNHFSKSWKTEEREEYAYVKTGLNTFDDKCRLVYSARNRKGKLRTSVTKPLKPHVRKEVCDRFIEAFKADIRCMEAYDKVQVLKPPNVKGFVRPMNKDDKKPCIMGEVVRDVMTSRSNLICNKILGTNYRTQLSDREKKELESENFWEKRAEEMRLQNEQGFEIHSPSGLPVVRFIGNQRFTRPMVYNFNLDVKAPYLEERPFVYRGSYVTDLKPCLYGGATLDNNYILCFGIGIMNGKRKAFYKEGRAGRLSCVDAKDENTPMVIVRVNEKEVVAYINKEDWSPIDTQYIRHVPGLEGSNVAIINYAGYLRSSSVRGFEILQEVFESQGSFMPSFMWTHMPKFPRYHRDAVEFDGGRIILIGETMVSKVIITTKSSRKVYVDINDDPKEVIVSRMVF